MARTPDPGNRPEPFENARTSGNKVQTYIYIYNRGTHTNTYQDIPTYTNLSEGRGIFSSRTIERRLDLDFTPAMEDSIRNSTLTKELNFN
jgi:hypothetical protein